ncbi:MAG: glycosyltransferase [Algoriphagus sp.]|uniref:glycosyltransferase n=1 Tax=Algoriphagus sp. TaxID=1872435 RepID=UPI00181BF421|nr:glycosyltransferase [Algoriphagus sp.]NVJ86817.1 glycosyltransferase [Algoriphagus sp.]
MKLLFTQDALVNAGAERSHLEILSSFSKDVDVGFVYFYPKHDLKDAYERAGFRLFFLDIPESYHFHLAIYRLVQLIKKEKPDLLVSSLWRADIITRIASKITRVPLVGTLVNDSYAPIAWTDKKGIKYKLVYWLDWLTSGIPKFWIANAQALSDSHVKTLGIDRDKISVVYRGRKVPELTRYNNLGSGENLGSKDKGEGNREKGNGNGEDGIVRMDAKENVLVSDGKVETGAIRNFISYGRLLERKGFQDAIQAFSKVLKKYPDCTLTIFGEGPYRKNLESLIQELGAQKSVFLPGKIQNPMDTLLKGYYFQISPNQQILTTGFDSAQPNNCQLLTANCFIFPSWYEGFSGALVEAMMAGIPIIASDIPMNLEAVTDQKSALVFPVQNIESLKECMLWAIENPDQMEGLGNEARKVSIERFDIEKIALQYEQILVKIAYRIKQN